MIVIPHTIAFIPWADSLFIDLPDLDIPKATSEDDWKRWARELININQLSSIPVPETFSNWREWAYYFVNNVS